MTDPHISDSANTLEPVHAGEEARESRWTARLVLFLRIMAALSMIKGLYHWAQVCGIGSGPGSGFESHPTSWQTATIYFAVIDLVAAVGLWLAAAWGAVVWLTAGVSMAAVAVLFPHVFGDGVVIVAVEAALLVVYLFLALKAARERPP